MTARRRSAAALVYLILCRSLTSTISITPRRLPFWATTAQLVRPVQASPPPGVWPYEVPALAPTIRPTQVVWAYNDNNIKRNYVYQWNLSIQRQLTSDTTVVVGYIGSRGYRSTPSAWTRHGRWESRSPSWSAPSRAYFNSFFAPIRDCLMRISCRRPAHLERD